MAERFTVEATVSGDVGVLQWQGAVDPETLARAVATAADDQLVVRGLRRLEVSVPLADDMARRALHRAGFRREGIRRQALQVDNGDFVDVALYARLATDAADGPAAFSGVMDSVLPTKRVICHVLFRDAEGRVLLLQTSYKRDWELPGGVVEPGEPPRVGGEREVVEELGTALPIGPVGLVDWMPPYLGWGDAVEFIHDGGVLDAAQVAAIQVDGVEVTGAHWVAAADLDEHVTPLSARRIRLLLSGFRGMTEDGVPVG